MRESIKADRDKKAAALRKERYAKRVWLASGQMPWSRREWRWHREYTEMLEKRGGKAV